MKILHHHSTAVVFAIVLGSLSCCELVFTATGSSPRFVSTGTFGTGSQPVSVSIGDLNNDGYADLVVANQVSADVSVLLGKGNGTFFAATNYPAGSGPTSVLVRDLNNDGKLDLVVSDVGSTNLWVLLGNGNGTFQPAVSYAVGYEDMDTSQSVAAGDFNHDGKLDLAAVNRGANTVAVLSGNANGTFQAPAIYDTGVNPVSVAVGDFNGDGNLDLAVANSAQFDDTYSSVSVLLGNTNGTFPFAVEYPAGTSPRSVAVGDVNGDGKLDLVVANFGGFGTNSVFTNSSVSVLIGNGNGTFQAPMNYAAGEGPLAVLLTDVNADGQSDLVVVNNRSQNVSILFGNSNGTFQVTSNYGTGANPQWVAAGDLSGDGQPDLSVATSGGVLVLLNTGMHLTVLHNNNTVTVSWPFPATGFVLESKASLSLTNWLPTVEMPTTNDGCWEVIVPASQGERYFRLRKP